MKIDKEFILDFIKLIKPEFYNKLTWLVVLSGIALMGSPFWQEILVAFLKKELDLNLLPGGNTLWGFLLVLAGLIYNLVTNSFSKSIESTKERDTLLDKRTHDINIFNGSEEHLTEEEFVEHLDDLINDHSYMIDESKKVGRFQHYFLRSGSQYIDKEIQKKLDALLESIMKIVRFTSLYFEVFPRKQTDPNLRLCMHPTWNIDREWDGREESKKKYEEATKELDDVIELAGTCYEEYRLLVKQKLFV